MTNPPKFPEVEEALAGTICQHIAHAMICKECVILAVAEEVERARAEAYKRGCTDITKFDVEVAQPEALEQAHAEGIAQGRRQMARETLEQWDGDHLFRSWLESQTREEAKR